MLDFASLFRGLGVACCGCIVLLIRVEPGVFVLFIVLCWIIFFVLIIVCVWFVGCYFDLLILMLSAGSFVLIAVFDFA